MSLEEGISNFNNFRQILPAQYSTSPASALPGKTQTAKIG